MPGNGLDTKDESGNRYHRLLVLHRWVDAQGQPMKPSPKRHKAMWVCLCDCGRQTVVEGTSLRRGHTKSCGCYRSDVPWLRKS